MEYEYAPTGRLVGRRAEMATPSADGSPLPEEAWQPELRWEVLSADGLPASSTFVWDPVSDRIVAVYEGGASETEQHEFAAGGLLRQMIHGDLSYDDPLQVKAFGSLTGAAVLHPVYDEAADGSLQALLGADGMLAARHLRTDPYGGGELAMRGAAVDRAEIELQGGSEPGTVAEVRISIRLTDPVAAETISGGAELVVLSTDQQLVRESSVAPVLIDDWTIHWTLSGAEWGALTDSAPATTTDGELIPHVLSVRVTDALRSEVWGAVPILPAPDWAEVLTSVDGAPELPFQTQQSLTSLSSWEASLPTETTQQQVLYEVPALALLAAPSPAPSRLTITAPFHASPFQEPITGLVQIRARWLDPTTGTFLSPDPLGHQDSSNLYAFCGGDPVNGRDPTGLYEEDVHRHLTIYLALKAGFSLAAAHRIGRETQALDLDDRDAMFGGGANNPNMVRYHFVSPGRLLEMRRQVLAGGQLDEGGWRAIGEFLHAWEDSYSHQKDLWRRDFRKQFHDRHPLTGQDIGHGRHKHEPDWTWKRRRVAMTMAETTFDQLVTLCEAYKDQCTGKREEFGSFEEDVRSFVGTGPEIYDDTYRAGSIEITVPDVVSYEKKVNILGLSTEGTPEAAQRAKRVSAAEKRRKQEEERRQRRRSWLRRED